MPWTIRIKGKFITGTSTGDEELAKKRCVEMLEGCLIAGRAISSKTNGLFQWVCESVEAEAWQRMR